MTNKDTPGIEQLLAHSDWVGGLARRLVTDAATADDVVQEAWLEALRRPPAHAGNLRGWLASVVSNVARKNRGAATRRKEQETAAARPEALSSTAELVSRAELQREVVGDVLALGDPYREVLLLRYFEDLPPRKIALRLGRPIDTVRTQLQRGHERLRARQSERHGDTRVWALFLIPLARTHPALTAPGLLLMPALWLLCLALGGGGVFLLTRPDASDSEMTHAQASAELRDDEPSVVDAAQTADERELIAHATESVPASTTAETRMLERRLAGRVVDLRGTAQSGLTFRWSREGYAREAVTAADGWLDIPIHPYNPGELECMSADTLFFAKGTRSSETVFLVLPAMHLSGLVTDEEGRPLEEAEVAYNVTPDFLDPDRQFGLNSGDRGWYRRVVTDIAGEFDFGEVQSVVGARIRVKRPGYEDMSAPLPDGVGHAHVPVALTQLSTESRPRIRGTVVDLSGLPVEGAHVGYGHHKTASQEDGSFELYVSRRIYDGSDLTAWVEGQLPALLPGLSERLESVDEVDDLTLTLGGSPLSIRGTVKRESGELAAGWRVALADGTPFGGSTEPLESRIRGFVVYVASDPNGAFELRGLLPREYSLSFYDAENHIKFISEPVRSGMRDVEIVIPDSAIRPELRGSVVTHNGEPVPHAQISADVITGRNGSSLTMYDPAPKQPVDANGGFLLRNTSRDHSVLSVCGEGIRQSSFPITDQDMVLVVTLLCESVIDAPAEVTGFMVYAADGTPLQLETTTQTGWLGAMRASQSEGKPFGRWYLPNNAVELVYHLNGEKHTIPLTLDPEQVNEIQL